MKFAVFTEWDTTSVDEITKKMAKLQEEMEQFPDKYPKPISSAYNLGEIGKAIGLYEAETEEQLINLTVHWYPEVKMKWVPLLEGPKVGKVWAAVKG